MTTVKFFGWTVLLIASALTLRAQWTFHEQNRPYGADIDLPSSAWAEEYTTRSNNDEIHENIENYLPLERNLFGAEMEYELPLRQSAGYFVDDRHPTSDLSVFATRDFEEIFLAVEVQRPQQLQVQIRNATGKVIAQDQYALKTGANHLAVSTRSLHPGLYIMEVRGADVHMQERFVIQ